jgi:hypothetical protein
MTGSYRYVICMSLTCIPEGIRGNPQDNTPEVVLTRFPGVSLIAENHLQEWATKNTSTNCWSGI